MKRLKQASGIELHLLIFSLNKEERHASSLRSERQKQAEKQYAAAGMFWKRQAFPAVWKTHPDTGEGSSWFPLKVDPRLRMSNRNVRGEGGMG